MLSFTKPKTVSFSIQHIALVSLITAYSTLYTLICKSYLAGHKEQVLLFPFYR